MEGNQGGRHEPSHHPFHGNPHPSRASHRVGLVMQAFVALFLAFDTLIKLVPNQEAIEGTVALGWQADSISSLGAIGLACLILYLLPRTAILGAILWTGYLGGAIATHLRVGNPLASHTLFPIYVAVLLWGALWLRDERLRALVPLRAPKEK